MNTESQTDRITQLEIERDEAKVATDFANLRIEQLEAELANWREFIDRWKDLKAMVPQPPNAITWEHGVELLNKLQDICWPRQPAQKDAPQKGTK